MLFEDELWKEIEFAGIYYFCAQNMLWLSGGLEYDNEQNEGNSSIRLHLNGAQLNSLWSKLQQAEAKAATAQEKERAVNERLTQTLSRMAVMEAQVCGTAETMNLKFDLTRLL